ncbi:MAG: hypothetical protein IMZ61_13010 [Planctomycetes bacterium]|nr:hypothetical protein [Planctomycetota bacterium]
MITGIGGLPGSGKSYYALERIYQSLARGKVVYTNMRSISIHKIAWSIHRASGRPRQKILDNFRIIDTWEMADIWKMGISNAEIYLDEVMIAWLARDWAKMSRQVLDWFSQHRKMRVNFTYIAQSIDKVDGTLRDMTQTFILMRNTSFWKFSVFRLPQMFLAIHYAEDQKNILKREWVIPIKKYYAFYDSWVLFPSKRPVDLGGGNGLDFSVGRAARSAGGSTELEDRETYPLNKNNIKTDKTEKSIGGENGILGDVSEVHGREFVG